MSMSQLDPRFQRMIERERQARRQAEALLNDKSIALYDALQQSQSAQRKLELALWASQESFWEWFATTDIFVFRGFSQEQNSTHTWQGSPLALLNYIHPDDMENVEFYWALVMNGGRDRIEVAFRFRSGRDYQWMRLRGACMERDASGHALYVIGTTRDITREREAEQSFHLMASAFSSSREAMLVLSADMVISECNQACLKLLGISQKSTCVGVGLELYVPELDDVVPQLESQQQVKFDTYVITVDEREVPVEVSLARFAAQFQSSYYVIATIRDITERKLSEEKLRHIALHDSLTGLKNRYGFQEQLYQRVVLQHPFVLLFIDLDGFKHINDTIGHDQGDLALEKVAGILLAHFPTPSECARWGGDEFVVMLNGSSKEEVQRICLDVIKAIEQLPIAYKDTELMLSASIGIAYFPEQGQDADTLLQNADVAMYHAKTSGKGCVYEYQHGLVESMKAQVSLLADLRRAIDHHNLSFYIQGKYDLNGYLKGGELLCRWRSAVHGNVRPDVFIPLAEAHQLDGYIGLQALDAACDYIAMMEARGCLLPLAVNISANQMLDPTFLPQALRICEENHVDPALIELELTESLFIQDHTAALKALNAAKEAGFRLVLDDFGTGFSSIGYLRSFDFQVVKLDRSLIKDIDSDSKVLSLFRGVMAMLNSLQVEVVVEGLEKASYLPFMEECHVNLLQGFYFDKPLPYDHFMSRMRGTEGV